MVCTVEVPSFLGFTVFRSRSPLGVSRICLASGSSLNAALPFTPNHYYSAESLFRQCAFQQLGLLPFNAFYGEPKHVAQSRMAGFGE